MLSPQRLCLMNFLREGELVGIPSSRPLLLLNPSCCYSILTAATQSLTPCTSVSSLMTDQFVGDLQMGVVFSGVVHDQYPLSHVGSDCSLETLNPTERVESASEKLLRVTKVLVFVEKIGVLKAEAWPLDYLVVPMLESSFLLVISHEQGK